MKKIFNLSLLTLGLVLPAAVSAYGSLSSSTFDGGGGDWDSGESAALDAATGGVYVAGTASSPVSGQNLWVGRYDANAVLVSSFSLNGAANSQDWGRAIAVDSGGNVWAAGYTKNPDQDITLVKLTPSLVFLASATFNGSASETASGIAMDSDNNAYVVGYSSAGTQDLNAVILKYDSSAHFVSSVSVNGSAATGDQAHGIYIDAGNNLWVTGLLNEAAGGYNAWAGKFDTNLNLLDSGTFDGAAGGYDEFKAAAPAAGGGLWVTGLVSRASGYYDLWLARLDASLNMVSSTTFSGAGTGWKTNSGGKVAVSPDGNVWVAGYIEASDYNDDAVLLQYTPALTLVSSVTVSGTAGTYDLANGLVINSSHVWVAGLLDMTVTWRDIWAARYDAVTGPPAGLAGSGLGVSSIAWNWNDQYFENFYLVANGTGGALSPTLPANTLAWAETALSTNTQYGRLVVASNTWGVSTSTLISAYTLAAPPAGLTLTQLAYSSASASWSAATNPGWTQYNFMASTAADLSGTLFSSATLNTSAVVAGLWGNATYYFTVSALNGDGLVSAYQGVPVQGATPPIPPGTVSPAFTEVYESSFTVHWASGAAAGFNRPETSYVAQVSTAPDFSGSFISSQTTGLQAAFSGLSGGVLYYARAAAFAGAGTSAYTALGSTATPSGLMIPDISTPAFSGVGASGLTVNFTSGTPAQGYNPGGTDYIIRIGTSAGFTGTLVSSRTLGLQAAFSGLSANTTYFLQAAASDGVSTSAYKALGSTATLAAEPAAAAFSGVSPGLLTANWADNGNPAGLTLYEVQLSTNPGFAPVTAASGTYNAYALFSGLVPDATYYARVRAVNHNGVPTNYTDLASTRTAGAPAGFGGAAAGTAGIAWSWSDVAYEDGYRVLASTDLSVLVSRPAGTLSWTETGLSTNTAYSRSVAATFGSGASTSAAAQVYTLAAPPTGFAVAAVFISSAEVSWQANGNPAGTVYEAAYWTAGSSTSTVSVTVTSAAFTGLSAGVTTYLTVRAGNGDGYYTAYDVTASTMIPAAVQTVEPGREETVVYNGPSGAVTVEVPAGAFAAAVVMTVRTPDPASVPAETGELNALATPVVAEITLSQGAQPAKDATIKVSYRQGDLGTADEGRLVLARHDTARGVWVPLFSTRDTVNNTVTALTDHFSLFQIMEAASAQRLGGVTAGPVPWLASRDTGTPITFRNLPSGAKVRIYTILGELVYETAEDGTGMAAWNVKNRSGKNAASGVYIVLLSKGGSSKKIKVVVER